MYFKYNNTNIYYEKHGTSSKSVLILPGWGDTRKTFNNIINELKEKYSVYIIDYPGFGNSMIPKHELDIFSYSMIIRDFMNELKIVNPVVIAHSFGGRIVSILNGKYKIKFKKIILIDVAGIRTKKIRVLVKEKLYKFLRKMAFLFPSKFNYKERLLRYFASSDYSSLPKSMRGTFQNIIGVDLRNYYRKISADTLIIWGEKDNDTPLSIGRYLNRIIENSALIIYQDASHYAYLNKPILTIKIINTFLNDV